MVHDAAPGRAHSRPRGDRRQRAGGRQGGGRQSGPPPGGFARVNPLPFPDAAQTVETTGAPLRVTPMFKGLATPWSLAFLPNGDMLITEKAGKLRIVARRHARSAADRRHAGSLRRRAGRTARGRRASAVRAEPVRLPDLLEGQGEGRDDGARARPLRRQGARRREGHLRRRQLEHGRHPLRIEAGVRPRRHALHDRRRAQRSQSARRTPTSTAARCCG